MYFLKRQEEHPSRLQSFHREEAANVAEQHQAIDP
jgi:hypothetical protein